MDLREMPITRKILTHTNLIDGDPGDWRKVQVSPLDLENPDPLVPLAAFGILCHPIFAFGRTYGLTPYYGAGMGASPEILVRKPVAYALQRVDKILAPYNRRLVVTDGFRHVLPQKRLWASTRANLLVGLRKHGDFLSVFEEVKIGLAADELGSYSTVLKDELYERYVRLVLDKQMDEVEHAAEMFKMTAEQIAHLYVTFLANCDKIPHTLDISAPTAHGNGGAVDIWMVDTNTGKYVNMGVPCDYIHRPGVRLSPGVIDYFEIASPEEYLQEVVRHEVIGEYLLEVGVGPADDRAFYQAQRERRLLKHAVTQCGGSYYSLDRCPGECWHFEFGNELEGNQAKQYPGAGNNCHSTIKDVRGEDGKWIAVWGNKAAHMMAEVRASMYGPL